jgi:hypothetical protein
MTYRVTLLDGKYTVEHTDGSNFKAYRNGCSEVWRDLTGDGLVLALVQKIEELEDKILHMENLEWERVAGDNYD